MSIDSLQFLQFVFMSQLYYNRASMIDTYKSARNLVFIMIDWRGVGGGTELQ